MLVGTLEIDIGRPFQVGPVFQRECVRRARIEPDVENVHHLRPRLVGAAAQEPFARALGKPCIGALGFEGFEDAGVDGLVLQHIAVSIRKDSDWHAPGALARQHPVGALGDHGAQPRLSGFRHEARGVYRCERARAQRRRIAQFLVHVDKPLRRVAEDDRLLRAPRMRVLVLQAPAGEQRVALDQFVDHRLVGIALLAVIIDDASRPALAIRSEAWRIFCVVAGVVHRERQARVDAALFQFGDSIHPRIEVLAAMAWRGVHEAGAGVVGDVVSGEHGNREFVAAAKTFERMGKRKTSKLFRRNTAKAIQLDLGLCLGIFGKRVGKDQLLARLRTKIVLGRRDVIKPVAYARRIVDRAVAGDGPGRGRPDDNMRVLERSRTARHRKLHPDRVALIILVLDLRFGQRGALNHGPHHRLGAAVKLVRHGELQKLAGNARLGMKRHRRVRVVEIAFDAEPLELVRLHLDPVRGELPAFLAEFVDRHLVLVLAVGPVLFLDLPLDRQPVAVPARHIIRVIAAHLERAGDDVLEDLVQRMPDMDVAVGVGRAVMQNIFLAAGRILPQLSIHTHVLPALDQQRLLFRQAGAHRKIRLRQIERFGIVDLLGRIGHITCHEIARRRRPGR